ncbi:MAG TPA: hypothetical protein VES66_08845 [Terriglobales bacterium]|nr:hypothetical protein [Terriglobales bacterium]
MAMKPMICLVMMSLLLSGFAALGSRAASSDNSQPSSTSGPVELSADDFDWRDMLPSLYEAAGLPAEEGIKEMLENSRVLRAYVATDIQAQCKPGAQPCGTKSDGSMLQAAETREIDEIVREGIFRRHKITRVDYPLTGQPFPFTSIAAAKTQKHRDAYLVLDFTEHSYTAAQLQEKYGAPYDTIIFQWFSMYKYRLDTKTYAARAAFTINPVDGEVRRVTISLKRKDRATGSTGN